jgi:hypothetical protein
MRKRKRGVRTEKVDMTTSHKQQDFRSDAQLNRTALGPRSGRKTLAFIDAYIGGNDAAIPEANYAIGAREGQ